MRLLLFGGDFLFGSFGKFLFGGGGGDGDEGVVEGFGFCGLRGRVRGVGVAHDIHELVELGDDGGELDLQIVEALVFTASLLGRG